MRGHTQQAEIPTYVVCMPNYDPNTSMLSQYTFGARTSPSSMERELAAIRERIESERADQDAPKGRLRSLFSRH